jgi:hypothetical protein
VLDLSLIHTVDLDILEFILYCGLSYFLRVIKMDNLADVVLMSGFGMPIKALFASSGLSTWNNSRLK